MEKKFIFFVSLITIVFVSGCINTPPGTGIAADCFKASEDFKIQNNAIVAQSSGLTCEFSVGAFGVSEDSYVNNGELNNISPRTKLVPEKVLVSNTACLTSIGFPTNYSEIVTDENQNIYGCWYLSGT